MILRLLVAAVMALAMPLSPLSLRAETAERPSVVSGSKPNVVLILADDLGYGDLSCYGAQTFKTPTLDELAREGFKSTNFFVPASVCSPTRAALLTGRYPMRNGFPVPKNPSPVQTAAKYGLHPDEITIAELLKQSGYQTSMVGKWHLGFDEEGSHPNDAGFDAYFGIKSNYYRKKGFDTLYRNKEVVTERVNPAQLTKLYTDEAVSFIEKSDGPFFFYFAHHIVHSPYIPHPDFVGTSDEGKYGDFIQEMDASTARVMKALDAKGITENTLVIFLSDNGGVEVKYNGGFSGGKLGTMEGGHRVPAIVRWPGVIPEGQSSDVLLTAMDLFPLIAKAVQVELPGDRVIDGKDISAILRGAEAKSPHEFLYYYNGINLQAVRQGKWKLHLPRTEADQPWWALWKRPDLIVHRTLDKVLLHDLSKDPAEKNDLAGQYPEVVERLLAQAERARSELGDVGRVGTDQRVPLMENPQRTNLKKKKAK